MILRFIKTNVSAFVIPIAIGVFVFGYAIGTTVHELIEDQHVTVVLTPNAPDLSGPKYDNHCEDKPGEEITDLMAEDAAGPLFLGTQVQVLE